MTIDEALEVFVLYTSVDDRERQRAALQAVADRARAEGVAACVAEVRACMDIAGNRWCEWGMRAESVCEALEAFVAKPPHVDALARLLAAHGREAAAEALEAAAEDLRPTWIRACERLLKRAAALREASTTGSTGESEGQP